MIGDTFKIGITLFEAFVVCLNMLLCFYVLYVYIVFSEIRFSDVSVSGNSVSQLFLAQKNYLIYCSDVRVTIFKMFLPLGFVCVFEMSVP